MLSTVIPKRLPIDASGNFGGTFEGVVSGIKMTWTLTGSIQGTTATGNLEVQSNYGCRLNPTDWSVSE